MDKPKGLPWPMLKNSSGKPDAMLTFSSLFVVATLFNFLFGGSTFDYSREGGFTFKIVVQNLDMASVTALLGLVAAYVGRRHGVGQKPTSEVEVDPSAK